MQIANTAVKPGALFAGAVVGAPSAAGVVAFDAAGFTIVGAGVTLSAGGATAAAPAAGRGGAWVVGCFAAGICWR